MGNTTTTDKKKLIITNYPSHITEYEWISDLWSTSKQSKEVILSASGDQRTRAQPSDYSINDECDTKHSIHNIVRLKMEYSATCYGLGTGTIIHHTLNKSYVLTAAHNIVGVDEHNRDQLQYPQAIWIEINENTLNGYKTLQRYSCIDYHIHLSYIKYLQNGNVSESATGYDIAIVEVSDPANELTNIQPLHLRSFKSNIEDSMLVKVIGYPGERKLRGELHGMKGIAKIKYINDKIKYNRLITYDNIDTTGGQSGSPIFQCLDNAESKEDIDDEKHNHNIYKTFGKIVGVHVVGEKKKKLNYGTYLNDNMLQWISRITNSQSDEYEQYDCGVLLITSSKSKYAKRLNQIYAKCLKTKIMSTIKLYYDFQDEKSVKKQDVLLYLKQLFTEKRKSYFIFYCGESDENGNWIINNNKMDNISLNDVNTLANKKAKESMLFIVSDCNHSGNWVCSRYKYKFENIDCIQGSTKYNEKCNAGTFTSKYAKCSFWYQPKEMSLGGTIKTIGGGAVFDIRNLLH